MSNYPRNGSGAMERDYARDGELDAKLHTLLAALEGLEPPSRCGVPFDTSVADLLKRVRDERARLVRRYD